MLVQSCIGPGKQRITNQSCMCVQRPENVPIWERASIQRPEDVPVSECIQRQAPVGALLQLLGFHAVSSVDADCKVHHSV